MTVLANAERLYDIEQTTILALVEPMASVRLIDDVGIETISQAYSFAFRKLIERRTEIQTLMIAPELSELLHRSVAYQTSQFTPAKASTFAHEASGMIDKSQGLFMRLSESIDSSMSVEWKFCNDSRIWYEFGYRRDDFFELKRGLVWELATIKRLIAKLGIEQTDAPEVVPVDPVMEDGLYRSEREFVWLGDRYEWLTETMMDAIEVLFKAYKQKRKVLPDEMENKIGNLPDGGFFKVFEVDRAGWEKVHPVRKIVGGRANSGWYLIEQNSSQT